MPSIKDLWPDKWLSPAHLGNARAAVAIETVTVEELWNPRTKRHEPRLVLAFHAKTLRLPVNKTQALALADITRTDDYTRWVGHRVVLSAGTAPNGAATIVISPTADPTPPPPPAPIDDDDEDIDMDPPTAGDWQD